MKEPAPTPRTAQVLTHKCPHSFSGKRGGGKTAQQILRFPQWAATTVLKMCCVNTGIKKIMKTGIKKIMKLGCSPGQGRHLWEQENWNRHVVPGLTPATWASPDRGRLLRAGACSKAQGRDLSGSGPPLCRTKSVLSFPLPFSSIPDPDSEVCKTPELLGAAVTEITCNPPKLCHFPRPS